MSSIHTIILAAGKGTRMKSELPKVLHLYKEKPLLIHVLESVESAGLRNVTVVAGYKNHLVEKVVQDWQQKNIEMNVDFSLQKEQLGTGHAILVSKKNLPKKDEIIVVLLGDVPQITSKSILMAIEKISSEDAKGLVITMKVDNPSGYGRIIRDKNNQVVAIREEKDSSEEEKKIQEVNTGIFLFEASSLIENLDLLKNQNNQNEYYLTDMVEIFNQKNLKMTAWMSKNPDEFVGINSIENLKQLEEQKG